MKITSKEVARMAHKRGISISEAHRILSLMNIIDSANKAESIEDLKKSIVFLLEKQL